MKALSYASAIIMGCDPEFFFVGKNTNSTVGAEKLLPTEGLKYRPGTYMDGSGTHCGGDSKIVIDGVQAELNPRPNTCRANLGNEISACFRSLKDSLTGKDVNVAFKPVVEVSKEEMNSLSEKSKMFGCAPSTNVYEQATSQIKVDPKKYLKRSAGGHIHLGYSGTPSSKKALENVDVMVPILDIIVGNTCVLIDRNPINKERRKVYGKVGEYRVKPYGLEYRTLSNFWLQSYQLMSFVMGLARFAVHVVEQTREDDAERNYVKALMDAVNREDIIKAIQNNDFALAYSNFLKIEPILLELANCYPYSYPLSNQTIKAFHWFVNKGVNYWFKEDPFTHWTTMPEGHGRGWESFAMNTVANDMLVTNTTTTTGYGHTKATNGIFSTAAKDFETKLNSIREMKGTSLKELRARIRALKALDPSPAPKRVKKVEEKPVEVLETVKPVAA